MACNGGHRPPVPRAGRPPGPASQGAMTPAMPRHADSPSAGEDRADPCRTAARAITRMAPVRRTPGGRGSAWAWLVRASRSWPWCRAAIPALGSSRQAAASTASEKQQTIRVLAVFTEFDATIDVGAAGFSLGDQVVFSGNLRDGQQVGRIGVVCTLVSTANAARVEAQCPATSILPGGQLTTQGTIVNRSLHFTLPITGGSGRYQGRADRWSRATSRRRPSPGRADVPAGVLTAWLRQALAGRSGVAPVPLAVR